MKREATHEAYVKPVKMKQKEKQGNSGDLQISLRSNDFSYQSLQVIGIQTEEAFTHTS